MSLKDKIKAKIESLGVKDAAMFFGVSPATVSNWNTGKTSPSIDALELVLGGETPLPKPETPMWEGREVAVLLPCYKTMNPDTHYTLFANYVLFGPTRIAIPKPLKQTCIWEARNLMINKAYRDLPSVKTFQFFDDDMIFPHGHAGSFNSIAEAYGTALPDEIAGQNTIARLMSHGSDKGIVGLLYFGRHARGKAQCQLGFTNPQANEELRRFQRKGLIADGWVGTGGMKIERWVIEKMMAAVDAGKWPECRPRPDNGVNYYGLFNPMAVGVGEDVSFCYRANEIGIQSYVDASLHALHAGDCYYGAGNTKN